MYGSRVESVRTSRIDNVGVNKVNADANTINLLGLIWHRKIRNNAIGCLCVVYCYDPFTVYWIKANRFRTLRALGYFES